MRGGIRAIRRSTLSVPHSSPLGLNVRFNLLDIFGALLQHVYEFLSILHPLPLIMRAGTLPQIFPWRD